MNKKNLLSIIALASFTLLFNACKVETANPANDVVLGKGEYTLILEANLNSTNDTTKTGAYKLQLEPVSGITVIATTNKVNFYANPNYSYNFSDEVITGVTDASGKVTLSLPVGENDNIQYRISLSDKLVEQTVSTSINDPKEEKIASYNGNIYANLSKGKTDIQRIQLNLN